MAKHVLDEARAEQSLAEPRTDNKVKFELSKELLTELHNNAYYGMVEEDVIDHIGNCQINTWEGLVKKFFEILYPISCASNYDKMYGDDEEGRDPLEFITWTNSKFKDHKKVDERTKRTLLHLWIKVGRNKGIMDDIVSSDDEWEESDYGNPPNTNDDSLLEPYSDAYDKNGINATLMQYDVSMGLGYGVLTTCTDLAVKKSTIWYTLKKTCVELVRAF
ncbi:hypothetical protein Tco_1034532 [Tanacetum coccineum]